MTERGSLRDCSHGDASQWNTNDGAQHESDREQPVIDDAVMQQSAADRQQHARFARPDAVPGRGGRTHPLERQDEQHARDEIKNLDDELVACKVRHHGLPAGRLALNIRNMRSVIRKPPTMLLVPATTAMNPKVFPNVLLGSPTTSMSPTTA